MRRVHICSCWREQRPGNHGTSTRGSRGSAGDSTTRDWTYLFRFYTVVRDSFRLRFKWYTL
jgi:hypothetical protein